MRLGNECCLEFVVSDCIFMRHAKVRKMRCGGGWVKNIPPQIVLIQRKKTVRDECQTFS